MIDGWAVRRAVVEVKKSEPALAYRRAAMLQRAVLRGGRS